MIVSTRKSPSTLIWGICLLLVLACQTTTAPLVVAHATTASSESSSSSRSSPKTREDLYVDGLDEIVPEYAMFDGDMYAGLLPTDNVAVKQETGRTRKAHGNLMFWLFAPNKPVVDDTLVIWLNGGPGCSSFTAGVMMETAPVMVAPRPAGYCCVTEDEPLVYNPYAWTNATAMLYIEQPVGVGFSYGGPQPDDEEDVSNDVYAFLMNFYDIFEEFKDKRLFIVGESYAGMYVPSIAHKIHTENERLRSGEKLDNPSMKIELGGIALGNGWVDARVQGPATIDYAYWHGMIDSTTRDNLHKEWEHCMNSDPDEAEPAPFHKFTTPDDCAMMGGVLMASGAGVISKEVDVTMSAGPNTYDVSTYDSYDALLWGNNTVTRFYNDPRIKEKLHAPMDTEWMGCIPGAGRRRRRNRRLADDAESHHDHSQLSLLEHDNPISTLPYMAELLDAKDENGNNIRVLVYNGDRDLSTNAQGSEMLLDSMEWHGSEQWTNAQRGLWVLREQKRHGSSEMQHQVAGYTKEYDGLSFVVVYNSGHLVPFNQPAPALDLIIRFLENKTFVDFKLTNYNFENRTHDNSGYNKKQTTERSPGTMGSVPMTQKQAEYDYDDDWDREYPHNETIWKVVALIVALIASFTAGYYTSNLRNGSRRHGYEEISSHGPKRTTAVELE